jgi:hypothetical protein
MCDKGKSGESPRRKATGPRFLRDAACDATKDPKIAGLPTIGIKQFTTVFVIEAQSFAASILNRP